MPRSTKSLITAPIDDGAPPYQLALTHVAGDVYFLAWQEGSSPAFRLHGQFVEVR